LPTVIRDMSFSNLLESPDYGASFGEPSLVIAFHDQHKTRTVDNPRPHCCPVQRLRKEQKADSKEAPPPLKYHIHIGEFTPEELKVSLSGRTITVEGHRSVVDAHSSLSASFRRSFLLTDSHYPASVYSKITAEGVLEIGARAARERVRPIKIEMPAAESDSCAYASPMPLEVKQELQLLLLPEEETEAGQEQQRAAVKHVKKEEEQPS